MPNLAAEPETDDPFDSYSQLARSLLGDAAGACLLDGKFLSRGHAPGLRPDIIAKWLRALGWANPQSRAAATAAMGPEHRLTAIPLQQTDGSLLGIFCVLQRLSVAPDQISRHADLVASQLKPLLDCVHRDLAAAQPKNSKSRHSPSRLLSSNGCSRSPTR